MKGKLLRAFIVRHSGVLKEAAAEVAATVIVVEALRVAPGAVTLARRLSVAYLRWNSARRYTE